MKTHHLMISLFFRSFICFHPSIQPFIRHPVKNPLYRREIPPSTSHTHTHTFRPFSIWKSKKWRKFWFTFFHFWCLVYLLGSAGARREANSLSQAKKEKRDDYKRWENLGHIPFGYFPFRKNRLGRMGVRKWVVIPHMMELVVVAMWLEVVNGTERPSPTR